MYTTSELYSTLIAQEGHWFETRVDIDGVSYGEEELMSVNASYRVFADEQPVVGGCLSAELTIKMLTPEEQIPRMAEVRPYVRVTDGTQSSEWISQGVFYIDTRDESHNNNNLSTTQIHCYDAMLKAEAEYPSTTHEWPMSDFEVVQEIALAMGVNIDPRTEPLMTEEYSIGLPAGFSMREVLGNIAAMYAGNWIMSFDGELRLVTLTELPEETNYLVDSLYEPITFGEPEEVYTVSGPVVTFNGYGNDARSVVADINPVQDLNGYDNPWPPGGGRNILNEAFESGDLNGRGQPYRPTGSTVYYRTANFSACLPNTTYYCKLPTKYQAMGLWCFDANKNGIVVRGSSYIYWLVSNGSTVTTPSNCAYIKLTFQSPTGTDAGIPENCCINVSDASFNGSYSPYSNICPISGWDSISTEISNKNLIPTGTDASNGYVNNKYLNQNGTTANYVYSYISEYFPVKQGVTYTWSESLNRMTAGYAICFYDKNKQYVSGILSNRGLPKTFTPPDGAFYCRASQSKDTTNASQYARQQIEVGETSSEFVSHLGSFQSIPLQNSVYSGTLDVTNGILKVRPYYSSYNGETLVGPWVSSMDAYAAGTTPTTGAQVVDLGGDETEIQISGVQVQTLWGTNNICADSGNITVDYTYGDEVVRILV